MMYRVNPIGVAEGKYSNKKRLIVDLSAPHNDSQNPSLNQLIDKEEYSLQYVKLDHAIDIIKSSGIILDSTSLEARLPVNKVQWINNILVSFLDKKSCTKRELLSLLGHLNFASRVRPGRSFVSHLIFLSTMVKELHHYVKLDTEVRSEIRKWQLFLQEWNGV